MFSPELTMVLLHLKNNIQVEIFTFFCYQKCSISHKELGNLYSNLMLKLGCL